AQSPMESVASVTPTKPPAEKKSDTGFSFNAYETPRELPVIPVIDVHGKPMSLEDFKGKTVLLNLWATWCVPCREEMPTLDRLQVMLGGDDFTVLALSLDQEGPIVVKEFYEELGLEKLDIYVDDRIRAPASLGVIGIPATLLIGGDGREIGRKLGPAEWDSPEVVTQIRFHLSADNN
ncbi:MAG: TlpA disulfide reductase family protein, partial [Gammaproteobacteria bacterium]|nr:TlpA disulfide reductase family protein [Gammaproteobacteria bacterium]